jgi:hypothetical protein
MTVCWGFAEQSFGVSFKGIIPLPNLVRRL